MDTGHTDTGHDGDGLMDTEQIHAAMPLCGLLGVTVAGAVPDKVVLELAWRPELCTIGGVMHGGALMALADSAGATCAFLNLPQGAVATTTIESKTNLMGAVTEGAVVTATATPLHIGRTTIVVETELRTDAGKLVAKTTQTQAVLMPR
jgi:1,4-dihydroxy-2-naphthoyl-CoA hydrolase